LSEKRALINALGMHSQAIYKHTGNQIPAEPSFWRRSPHTRGRMVKRGCQSCEREESRPPFTTRCGAAIERHEGSEQGLCNSRCRCVNRPRWPALMFEIYWVPRLEANPALFAAVARVEPSTSGQHRQQAGFSAVASPPSWFCYREFMSSRFSGVRSCQNTLTRGFPLRSLGYAICRARANSSNSFLVF
jgi:hypothetical protein